ncbi:hypothetical protein BY458DRAFT_498589 [Sporodiniella umbellata]|nr:hypothetical protein BY458DRAFT_498589 [Sporodiniella umbellata]
MAFPKKVALFFIASLCALLIPIHLYSPYTKPWAFLSSTPPEPYTYPPLVQYSYSWPKKSAKKTYNETAPIEDLLKEIDQKYCGKDRCRFLLPVAIMEQESKAQLHFRQLAFLAGKIGRTIVLPNVRSSRLGACLSNPFDFYYDQETWLSSNRMHFNYITMKDFQAWISERRRAGSRPSAQEIHIQGEAESKLLRRETNCFESFFDFYDRPTSSYQFPDDHHYHRKSPDTTATMMSLLSDEARQLEHAGYSDKPVDVINLLYDRRFQFIRDPEARQPLPYSRLLTKVANDIALQLKPFMAIHWRMERLEPVSNLNPCAKNLIQKIHQIDANSTHQHPNVYLLTDYPHLLNTPGARPESSSFLPSELKPEHHQAIQTLYTHLNVTLSSSGDHPIPYDRLPQSNWNILPIDTQGDQSILGIIDKLVAMQAQWFLAGKPGVCAKSSSFTGRISMSRLRAFQSGDENIIVPLDTFNLPPKAN